MYSFNSSHTYFTRLAPREMCVTFPSVFDNIPRVIVVYTLLLIGPEIQPPNCHCISRYLQPSNVTVDASIV